MKRFLWFVMAFVPLSLLGSSTWDLTVTFYNVGTKPYGTTGSGFCSAGNVQVHDVEYAVGGSDLANTWSGESGITHPVTNGSPLVMTWTGFHGNAYTATGYGCRLYFIYAGTTYLVTHVDNDWTSQHMAASWTITVNGDDCSIATNPPCRTNVVVAIPDNSYTNQIVLTISNWMCGGPANPQQVTYTGPLSGMTYQFSQVLCSNSYPYSITESNVPPCLPQPVCFSVVNTSTYYRLMAVYNTHDEAGGFINESLVSPGDRFFWSNSVPCGVDISGYQFWAADSTGQGFTAQNGITNMASGWESTNALGNGLSGGNGQSGQTSVGPNTVLTNVPPVNLMSSNQFPSVPWVTNDVVWSSGTNNDISHVTVAVEDSGTAIYQAVVTAAKQAHSDAGEASKQAHSDAVSGQAQGTVNAQGIINQVGAAEQQAHTDSQTLQGNAATAAGLAHNDAGAIVGAINGAGAVAHGDAGVIVGAIEKASYYSGTNNWNGDGAINGLTNWLGKGNASLVGISNLLARTNGSSLGSSNALMLSMASAGTNVVGASAEVLNAFSGPLGYLGDAITALATPPDVGADPGHASGWEFQFLTVHVDLDPVRIMPTAFTFCYGLVSWLLVVGYLFSVAQLYIKTVQILATAQSGGVPDLSVFQGLMGLTFGEFGGGNFIGVLVAVVVPSLMIGLWVVVVTALITPIGSMIGAFSAISGVFGAVSSTGPGAMACHILFSAFPIGLLIQLTAARLTLQFTMSRVMLVAVGVSRYLWGK
jgi:hypothetical protein